MSVNRTSGRRSYAENTYHALAVGRPNYFALLGAEATKIAFTSHKIGGKVTATGVTFTAGGQSYTANVKKEVIVSAGTLKTPQLLELSGIGNKQLLQGLGIPVLSDLPGVGEYMFTQQPNMF